MQQDPRGTEVPPVDTLTEETDRLIASDKVEGTAVYNRQGERLGSIHNFMVDKRLGHVECAILSFGGFLGIGDSYYPLPGRLRGRPRQGSARGRAAVCGEREPRLGGPELWLPDRRLLRTVPGAIATSRARPISLAIG